MSGGLRDSEIDFVLRVTAETAGADEAKAKLAATELEAKALGEEMKRLGQQFGLTGQQSQQLNDFLGRNRDVLQQVKGDADGTRTFMDAMAASAGMSSAEFEKLAGSLERSTGLVHDAKTATMDERDALQAMSDAQRYANLVSTALGSTVGVNGTEFEKLVASVFDYSETTLTGRDATASMTASQREARTAIAALGSTVGMTSSEFEKELGHVFALSTAEDQAVASHERSRVAMKDMAQAYRDAQAASGALGSAVGMTSSEFEKELGHVFALSTAEDQAVASHERSRVAMKDMAQAYRDAQAASGALGATLGVSGAEFNRLAEDVFSASNAIDGGGSGGGVTGSMNRAAGSGGGLGGVLMDLARNPIPALVVGLIALGTLIAPVSAAFVGWAIVTVSFTVGLMGLVGVIGLAVGAFGALALMVGLLADRYYTQAKTANDNLTKAQREATLAANAHANAVRALQNAQASAGQTSAATVGQLNSVANAHQAVATAASNAAAAQAAAARQTQNASAGIAGSATATAAAITAAQRAVENAHAAIAATTSRGLQPTVQELNALASAQDRLRVSQSAPGATVQQINAVASAQAAVARAATQGPAAQAQAARQLQTAEAAVASAGGNGPSVRQLNAVARAEQDLTTTATQLATANNNLAIAQLAVARTGPRVVDPLKVIEDHLQSFVRLLGEQAYPLLIQMAQAADDLVPPIQAAGSSLISWFGSKLPQVLDFAKDSLGLVGSALNALAPIAERFLDGFLNRRLGIEDLFNTFLIFGVHAIDGLLTNLMRLSDWFIHNFEAMAPVVMSGFDVMGGAVQRFSSAMAAAVTWVVANWPKITAGAAPFRELGEAVLRFLGALANATILPIATGQLGAFFAIAGRVVSVVLDLASGLLNLITRFQLLAPLALGVAAGFAAFYGWGLALRGIGLAETILTLAIDLGLLSPAMEAFLSQLVGVDVAMSANPIGLVAIAVAALIGVVVLLITHWSTVVSLASALWSWFVKLAASLGDLIDRYRVLAVVAVAVTGPGAAAVAGVAELAKHWDKVRDSVSTAAGAVQDFLVGPSAGAQQRLPGDLEAAHVATTRASSLAAQHAPAAQVIASQHEASKAVAKVNQDVEAARSQQTGALGVIGAAFSGLGTIAHKVADDVGRFFSGVGTIAHGVADDVGRFFNAVGTVFRAIADVVGTVMSVIWRIIITIFAIIAGIFIVAFGGLFSLAWSGMQAIGKLIWDAMKFIANTIGSFMSWIGSNFHAAWTEMARVLGPLIDGIGSAISDRWTKISRGFSAIMNDVGSAFQLLWTTQLSWIPHMLDSLWNAIKLGVTVIKDGTLLLFTGMVNGIGGLFSGLGTMLHSGLEDIRTVLDGFIHVSNKAMGINVPDIPDFGAPAATTITFGRNGQGGMAMGGVLPGYAPGNDSILAMLSPGEGVLTPQAVRLIGPETVMALNQGAHGFAAGGIVGTLLGAAEGVAGKALQAVAGGSPFIGRIVGGIGSKILDSFTTFLTKTITAVVGPSGGGGGVPGSSAQVQQWIAAALAATGEPASWVPGLEIIIQHESGGNPLAANNWDINAQRGDPSVGLMQLILSNQTRYGGITNDPVLQIEEGIKYILARYGDISNVPGVRSVTSGGPYLPYDSGGVLPPGGRAINTSGRAEAIMTAEQVGSMGPHLHFHTVGALNPDMVREAQRAADWHRRTGQY